MKRVLIVATDGLTKSGVPNVFMSLIRGLSSKDYCFDVLYFDKRNDFYKKEIESFGGQAIYCPIDEKKTSKIKKLFVKIEYCKTFKNILKQHGPYDCIHSFKGFESGYFLKTAKRFGVPVRIAHMTFLYKKSSNLIVGLIENKEKRLIEKYASLVISDSINTSNNNLPKCNKRVVIRNIVDDTSFQFKELDKHSKPISMIQIGSYCDNKNQLFSLSVLKNIVKKFPDSILHFVGFRNPDDNAYLDVLKSYVVKDNLERNVVFHEFDAEISKIFEKCHYLLFPSHFESFGIVPVEAQMSGLFCFCSDTISKENNCGGCDYLPISDAELWSSKIIDHYNASQGVHKKYDCSVFSKRTIIENYKKIYGGKQ